MANTPKTPARPSTPRFYRQATSKTRPGSQQIAKAKGSKQVIPGQIGGLDQVKQDIQDLEDRMDRAGTDNVSSCTTLPWGTILPPVQFDLLMPDNGTFVAWDGEVYSDIFIMREIHAGDATQATACYEAYIDDKLLDKAGEPIGTVVYANEATRQLSFTGERPVGIVIDDTSALVSVYDVWYDPTQFGGAGAKEFKDTLAYAPDEEMWMIDPNRATFVNRYRNDSGATIPVGAFDPTDWYQIVSGYNDAYGLEFTQTGLIFGGSIVETGVSQITITEGHGVILDKTDPTAPNTTLVEWDETIIDLPTLAADRKYYIFVNALGVIDLIVNKPSMSYSRGNIHLGMLVNDATASGEIGVIDNRPTTIQSFADTLLPIHEYFIKPQFVGGGFLRGVAAMNLDLDQGVIFGYNLNYRIDPNQPHQVTTPAAPLFTFTYILQDATEIANTNVLDPTQWDNAGAQDNVQPNRSTTQLVYFNVVLQQFYILLGQREYSSIEEARNQKINYVGEVVLPPLLTASSVFIGYVCMDEGTTDITNTDEACVETSAGSSFSGGGAAVEELDGLLDVVLANRLNGQGLIYDDTAAVWRNQDIDKVTRWFEVTGHAYTVGQVIDYTGALAQANITGSLGHAIVIDTMTDFIRFCSYGHASVPGHGLTVGDIHYLDAAVAGDTTATPPTGVGQKTQRIMRVTSPDDVFVEIGEDTSKTVGIREYVTGGTYGVDQIISQRGTVYKVTTEITTAPATMDPARVRPMNLGAGNAFLQTFAVDGASNWILLCGIKNYTSGQIRIGGLYNGKQVDILMDFVVNYKTSQWKIMLSQHSAGLVDQISIRQAAAGAETFVWLNLADGDQGVWDMHFIANAAGHGYEAVTLATPLPVVIHSGPGGVGGHYHDWIPSSVLKEQQWNSLYTMATAQVPYVQELLDGYGGAAGNHRTVGIMITPLEKRGKLCHLRVQLYLDVTDGTTVDIWLRVGGTSWGGEQKIQLAIRNGCASGTAEFYASNTPDDIDLQMRSDGESAWIYNQSDRGKSMMTLNYVRDAV